VLESEQLPLAAIALFEAPRPHPRLGDEHEQPVRIEKLVIPLSRTGIFAANTFGAIDTAGV